jgi:hypothetical protein
LQVAHASGTVVQEAQNFCEPVSSPYDCTLNFSSDVSTGDVIVVGIVDTQGAYTLMSVTDSFGSTYSAAVPAQSSSCYSNSGPSGICQMIYYATVPSITSSTGSVTVEWNSITTLYVFAFDVSGISGSSPSTGSGYDHGVEASTMTTSSVSYSSEGFLLAIGATYNGYSADGASAGTGFSLVNLGNSNPYAFGEYSTSGVSSPSTFPMSLTTSDYWSESSVAFNTVSAVPDLPYGVLPFLVVLPVLYYLVAHSKRSSQTRGHSLISARLNSAATAGPF